MNLIPASSIEPSTYNPRIADPNRLAMIKLSLRKLGFLIPIYATKEGEILSGHQRHFVATEQLGWDLLPVSYLPSMDLNQRKAVNILFNRGTNDMAKKDTEDRLLVELKAVDVYALAERIPDKEGDARFPCLRQQQIPLPGLLAANKGRWNEYAAKVTKTLAAEGVIMPLVVKESDLTVVNGIGRLQFFAERKLAAAAVVMLTDEEAALASVMLNLLTMDFNIHKRYADVLRYNSFRRPWGKRPFGVGTGMTWPLMQRPYQFDIHRPDHVAAWKNYFGPVVLDFGAGQREDAAALNYAGITADVFEPYPLAPGTTEIDPELARKIGREFLALVAGGRQWSSIFMSAVMNSVPFQEDRRMILAIVASLCAPSTVFYTYSVSTNTSSLQGTKGRLNLCASGEKRLSFLLTYEPNVVLGDFRERPKMQKYWTQEEFTELLREFWAEVQPVTWMEKNYVTAICKRPRPVRLSFLRAALEFEFNLPYPDDSRMGLVDEALAAWSTRLGVTL